MRHNPFFFALVAILSFVLGAGPALAINGPRTQTGPASATAPGYVTTGAQTFAGAKTFTGATVLGTTSITALVLSSTLTASGTATFNKTAESGGETVATFKISDNASGLISIENRSPTDLVFLPQIRGVGSSSAQALLVLGQATTDSGSTAVLTLASRLSTNSSITTRPLLVLLNNATSVMAVSAAGGLDISGGTTPSIKVGASGTALTQMRVYAPTLTPASTAANTSAAQTFTVSGLTTADKVMVNGPALTAGTGIVGVRVSAADTLEITFGNFTGGPLTPVSGTYNIVAIRS